MSTIGSTFHDITLPQWKEIYQDLRNVGCNESQLAYLLNKERSTVQYWFERCAEPKYSEGCAIIAIHTKYCGEQLTKIRLNK